MKQIDSESLKYHEKGRPGKTEVIPTKPFCTPKELSLAYSPGVAAAANAIGEDRWNAYKYTNKGNLVAVVSDGSAVLGLGNIGATASKPVMEGKSMLFKIFADIDAFDIELAENDTDKLVETIRSMSATFGGINLEDISAPRCFEIEKRLRCLVDIPVLHDDRHGTAVTVMAALMNAAKIADKDFCKLKTVINGAGAAAITTARMLIHMGIKRDNILMFDRKGLISTRRTDLSPYKQEFATSQNSAETLLDAMKNADVFIGLSKGNLLGNEELAAMASSPIIFALANPTPEVEYDKACSVRPDAIVATGRTDTPNQLNNVLAFPYLFRGALDTYSVCINNDMLVAAAKAIAALARRPVPTALQRMYGCKLSFGREYILPKPNDRRLLSEVATAVAQAAISGGVARRKIDDWDNYRRTLLNRLEREHLFCREIFRTNSSGKLHGKYHRPMQIL